MVKKASQAAQNFFAQQENSFLNDLIDLLHNLQLANFNVKKIIQTFTQFLHKALFLGGVHYGWEAQQCSMMLGKVCTHQVTYTLQSDTQHFGELILYRSNPFTEQELLIVESLIGYLIPELHQAERYKTALQKSFTDQLTQVGNRQALDKSLKLEISRANRHQLKLSVLMLDIDHFKHINDTYGHPVGDAVLRKVAKMLHQCLRHEDSLFRYGGEEFFMLLPATDLAGCHTLAERMREKIKSEAIRAKQEKIQLTVSIGITEYQSKESREALIQRCDQALLQAKNQGRNCIVRS